MYGNNNSLLNIGLEQNVFHYLDKNKSHNRFQSKVVLPYEETNSQPKPNKRTLMPSASTTGSDKYFFFWKML